MFNLKSRQLVLSYAKSPPPLLFYSDRGLPLYKAKTPTFLSDVRLMVKNIKVEKVKIIISFIHPIDNSRLIA